MDKETSILKNFLDQTAVSIEEINFDDLIEKILAKLTEREQEIIKRRFGLINEPKTLAEIGKKMGFTRERIRQIVKNALDKIKKQHSEVIKPFFQFITYFIENKGGLIAKEALIKYFKEQQINLSYVTFLLSLVPDIEEIKETKSLKSFYILKNYPMKVIEPIVNSLVFILEAENKSIDEETLLLKFKNSNFYEQNKLQIPHDNFILAVLRISKEISLLEDENKIGLNKWRFVNPKNAADKAYFILQKVQAPLHFAELADKITKKFPQKKIKEATIHNELIDDPRFVLVGRGIYALAEWGYTPGTVAEIIEKNLREAKRPLSISEITERVLKERKVKKNTIVVNLQDKKRFKRVNKAVYGLAEQD